MRVDVAIVGAGPIGIETAIALAADGLTVRVLDAGAIGATILRTFPPDTRFFTSPERLEIRGWPIESVTQEKTTGEEYLAYLRSLVSYFDLDVRTFHQVTDIGGEQGDFTIAMRDRNGRTSTMSARYVVLATGGTDTPRRLGVPGEDLPNVASYLTDPHQYFQRRVLIVGGRNSAAESALRLYRAGARVSLLHREPHLHERVKFWLRPEVESLLNEGVIERIMPARVTAIEPSGVEYQLLSTGDHLVAQVDDVLLQIGFTQDQTLLRSVGVTFDEANNPEHDGQTMQTHRPGVFIAGTAIAGTQNGFTTFIENCHQHADRIAAAIAGRPAPPPQTARPLPES